MIQPRRHLRSDVSTEVQERLLSGQLSAGRINESELALELGISRTPLREALLVMEQRGLVESSMGRGFRVRELSITEAEELYPMLAVLEPLALRLGASTLAASAGQLRDILQRMATATGIDELLALSQAWSAVLVAACPNRKLATLLADLYRQSTRYERHNIQYYMAQPGFALQGALDKHHQIVDALQAGDSTRAAELIGATWQDCLDALRSNLPTVGKAS